MKKRAFFFATLALFGALFWCLSAPGSRFFAAQFPSVRNGLSESLFVAASKGDAIRMKWLLNRGADVNWTNYEGKTVLQASISNEFASPKQLLKVLDTLEGYKVDWNRRDKYNNTAFIQLIQSGLMSDESRLKYLKQALNQGANFNTEGIESPSPLWYAVVYQDISFARLLLDRGSNPNPQYKSPLLAAMIINTEKQTKTSREIIEILLKAGANPNQSQNSEGATPLKIARNLKMQDIVPLLQKYAKNFKK